MSRDRSWWDGTLEHSHLAAFPFRTVSALPYCKIRAQHLVPFCRLNCPEIDRTVTDF